MKKLFALALAAALTLSLASCSSDTPASAPGSAPNPPANSSGGPAAPAVSYPVNDINCIVPFAAGGGTDNLVRPLATLAQQELGVSLIVDNVTGASGATGMLNVLGSAPDGYTLLFSAENPSLYDAMEITDKTYDDLDVVFLIGEESVVLYVAADSPYQTIHDLIEFAKANPGKVTKPASGAAGLAAIADSIIRAATGAEITQVPADSDGDALIQVLGGQVTCGVGKMSTIGGYLEEGQIRVLASMTSERMSILPDVPAITESYPEFDEYFPWGSFYTVCVPQGTPAEVEDALSAAFAKAYENADFQKYMTDNAITPLGLTGEAANEYVANYRLSVVTALSKAGTITKTPEELGLTG